MLNAKWIAINISFHLFWCRYPKGIHVETLESDKVIQPVTAFNICPVESKFYFSISPSLLVIRSNLSFVMQMQSILNGVEWTSF